MPAFIPGLQLSQRFYEEVIRPALEKEFPCLPYSAALIGEGSEVVVYDTPQSTDHCWGPRIMLFVLEEDYPQLKEPILHKVNSIIPEQFLGYPTHFDCLHKDTVDIFTVRSFIGKYLSIDPFKDPTITDWLTFPSKGCWR